LGDRTLVIAKRQRYTGHDGLFRSYVLRRRLSAEQGTKRQELRRHRVAPRSSAAVARQKMAYARRISGADCHVRGDLALQTEAPIHVIRGPARIIPIDV